LRDFFRQTFRFAFFPLGGGGTRIARRIASSNLIGFCGFRNFGAGIAVLCAQAESNNLYTLKMTVVKIVA